MAGQSRTQAPPDAAERRAVKPVIVYALEQLPKFDAAFYDGVRADMTKVSEFTIPPRDATAFEVPAGHVFRIVSVEGPQVGDLNLWNAHDLTERFYSGKTRALHSTHVTTGDRLWSSIPFLRPMATITADTLAWYGRDDDGGAVHDVLGTRCDPYTNMLLKRRSLSQLLPLQPDPLACCRAWSGGRRSRAFGARRRQRLHVHWRDGRHKQVLHEGQPGKAR